MTEGHAGGPTGSEAPLSRQVAPLPAFPAGEASVLSPDCPPRLLRNLGVLVVQMPPPAGEVIFEVGSAHLYHFSLGVKAFGE